MNYNSNEQITVINNEFYYSFFDKFKNIHMSIDLDIAYAEYHT